jgi:hypothetical protein
MILPSAPPEYRSQEEQTARQTIMREMARTRKRGQNIDLGREEITLLSPNGTRYALIVSDAGVLSTSVRP